MLRRFRPIAGCICAFAIVALAGGVRGATADDSSVATSFNGNTFTATFSGSDSDLSFTVRTDSFARPFVTGGGWVLGNAGGHASFGFVAGNTSAGGTSGELVFIDHSVGVRFKSTTIVAFDPSPCGAVFNGVGQMNGVDGFAFQATVADNGEPGTGRDVFSIVTSSYANAFVVLAGGDIQVHGQDCR
jgi:hypothetical protein